MSLLFPGHNLKAFRRFLDPHFSPTREQQRHIQHLDIGQKRNSHTKSLKNVISGYLIYSLRAWASCGFTAFAGLKNQTCAEEKSSEVRENIWDSNMFQFCPSNSDFVIVTCRDLPHTSLFQACQGRDKKNRLVLTQTEERFKLQLQCRSWSLSPVISEILVHVKIYLTKLKIPKLLLIEVHLVYLAQHTEQLF